MPEQPMLAHEMLLSDLAVTARALPTITDPAERATKVVLLKYLAGIFTRIRMSVDHARLVLMAVKEIELELAAGIPAADPDCILSTLSHTRLNLTHRLSQVEEAAKGEPRDEACSTQ